jgi:ABC-type antimicrobial peptide transport system ATPase subunit
MTQISTRYDKLSIVYRGGAVHSAITRWLQRLRDTPHAGYTGSLTRCTIGVGSPT